MIDHKSASVAQGPPGNENKGNDDEQEDEDCGADIDLLCVALRESEQGHADIRLTYEHRHTYALQHDICEYEEIQLSTDIYIYIYIYVYI